MSIPPVQVSLTARLLDHFVRGFRKPLKEMLIALALIIATYGYRYIGGRSSFAAWRQDFWEEAFPLIFIVLGLAVYHVIKAAYALLKEIQRESLQPTNPYPSLHLLGHELSTVTFVPTVPFYKTKTIVMSISAVALICVLGFGAYRLANLPLSVAATPPNQTTTPISSPVMPSQSPSSPTPTVAPTVHKPRRAPRGLDEEQRRILRDLNSNPSKHSHSRTQQQVEGITKEALQKALSKKLTSKGLKFLIEQVRKQKVSFLLNSPDERDLRFFAAEHGNKSLDGLIAAIRDSYRGTPNKNEDTRFFLDVTPRELVAEYIQKNPLQAELAVAGYKGKWLRVDVELIGIVPEIFPDQLVLSARDLNGVRLSLTFDRKLYIGRFAAAHGGERLTVNGIFDGVLVGSVMLKNCEINNGVLPESKKAESEGTLNWKVESVVSNEKTFPYQIRVILTPSIKLETVTVLVECSGLIGKATATVAGIASVTGKPEGQRFVFRASTMPAMGPQVPLVVNIWSMEAIKVVSVKAR